MKTRKRRQDPDAEYNFWQPATDMMSALVYVLLLIIALLGLYLLSNYTGLEAPSSSSEEAASSGWHDDDYDGWHDGAVPMMTPATAMDDTISRSSRPAAVVAAAATTRTALGPPCLLS